uniref:Uncharacterized protein n=1 Tax=Myotis myotis TaxID=51298 RepID=A0A7J7RRQ5_MYOMY|nr:hypothetical protein mMyoMyo1_010216 [Myotis myotis]
MNTVGLRTLKCRPPHPHHHLLRLSPFNCPKQVPHPRSLYPGDTDCKGTGSSDTIFSPSVPCDRTVRSFLRSLGGNKTWNRHRNGGFGQQQQSLTWLNTSAHGLHSTCFSSSEYPAAMKVSCSSKESNLPPECPS